MRSVVTIAAGIFLGLTSFVVFIGFVVTRARMQPAPAKVLGVHLSPGQECIAGTVVQYSLQTSGARAAVQALEFGKPIACEGEYRLAD